MKGRAGRADGGVGGQRAGGTKRTHGRGAKFSDIETPVGVPVPTDAGSNCPRRLRVCRKPSTECVNARCDGDVSNQA